MTLDSLAMPPLGLIRSKNVSAHRVSAADATIESSAIVVFVDDGVTTAIGRFFIDKFNGSLCSMMINDGLSSLLLYFLLLFSSNFHFIHEIHLKFKPNYSYKC